MLAREFNEKWNLTHQQLADLLGVGRATISHYLGAKDGDIQRQEPETIKRLLDVYNLLFCSWEAIEQTFPLAKKVFDERQGEKEIVVEVEQEESRSTGDRAIAFVKALARSEAVDIIDLQKLADELGVPSAQLAKKINGEKQHGIKNP